MSRGLGDVYKRQGLVLRPIGDILYFNPPLTIEKETMDEAVRRCAEAVHAVLGDD